MSSGKSAPAAPMWAATTGRSSPSTSPLAIASSTAVSTALRKPSAPTSWRLPAERRLAGARRGRVELAVAHPEEDARVVAQVAELVHLVAPAPRRTEVGGGRVVGFDHVEGDVVGPRMAVEAGADEPAVLVPAVAG